MPYLGDLPIPWVFHFDGAVTVGGEVWPAVTSLPAAVLDAVAAGRVRTAGREWPA